MMREHWLLIAALGFSLFKGICANTQKWELDIPRVSLDELSRNTTLQTGKLPYVLIDFAPDKWSALAWTLDYIAEQIPFEWVDYYPDNMADVSKKPYLRKLREVVADFKRKGPAPKYMQLRIGRRGWNRLKKHFDPKPIPSIFWDDDEWASKCMVTADGKVDKNAIHNFFVTQQWKFLLIGEKGSTMFFHKDNTAASSWQAQILGRKKWTLCPNTESRLLDISIDTHDPSSYNRFPRFAQALCGQVTVHPGDILYYPGYWWHQALQLDTPTVAYTGALVGVEADRQDLGSNAKPHAHFYQDLVGKCSKCWQKDKTERLCEDISLKWPGAAPPMFRSLCEQYLPECYKLWNDHAVNLHRNRRQEL